MSLSSTRVRTPKKAVREKFADPDEEKAAVRREKNTEQRRLKRKEEKQLDEMQKNQLARLQDRVRRQARKIDSQQAQIDEFKTAAVPAPTESSDDDLAASQNVGSASVSEDAFENDTDDSFVDAKSPKKKTDATKATEMLDRATKSDKRMQRFTGLSLAVFERQIKVHMPFLHTTTNVGTQTVRATYPQRWIVPPRVQFFITFVWLRQYWQHWVLAEIFGIAVRLIAKILKRVVSAIKRSAASPTLSVSDGAVRWPTNAELDHLARFNPFDWDGLLRALALDGMHCVTFARGLPDAEIDRDAYDAAIKQLTQPKHACFGTLVLLCSTLDGRIVWYTPPKTGHEQTLLKDSGLRGLVVESDVTVLSDAGLNLNIQKDAVEERCRTAQSVGPGMIRLMALVVKNEKYYTVAQRQWCAKVYYTAKLVSQLRIVIENVIAHLRFWKCMSHTWRGKFVFGKGVAQPAAVTYCIPQEDAFACVVTLYNAMRAQVPLRAADWRPNVADFPVGFVPGFPLETIKTKAGKVLAPPRPFANIRNLEGVAQTDILGFEKAVGVKKAHKVLLDKMKNQRVQMPSLPPVSCAKADESDESESDYDDGGAEDAAPVECEFDRDYVAYKNPSKARVHSDFRLPERHFSKLNSSAAKAAKQTQRIEAANQQTSSTSKRKEPTPASSQRQTGRKCRRGRPSSTSNEDEE